MDTDNNKVPSALAQSLAANHLDSAELHVDQMERTLTRAYGLIRLLQAAAEHAAAHDEALPMDHLSEALDAVALDVADAITLNQFQHGECGQR